jgi:Tol biopolymer transport system component
MTDPSFDRLFTAWLDERAPPHAPTGLAADIVERTAGSRPRPAWRVPERWFSMPTTIRLALIPRGLLLLFALWLILSLTVAGAAVGGRLAFTQAVLPAPVTGPAANGLIAFERDGDIHVVEPDGTDEHALIVEPGVQLAPSWSRDGTRIAYWSAATDAGPWDIMVANADGADHVTVASGLIEAAAGPDWSPDGSALLFAARTVPSGEAPCLDTTTTEAFCSSRIITAATDGSTGAVAIGDPDLDAKSPAWSPDGSLIAFAGGDAAASTIRLYLMAADGSDVRPVSTSSGSGWSFDKQDWSPDGTQIVTQVGQSSWDIILVAADGSGETMVTDTPTADALAAFAVDGSIGWFGDAAGGCCLQVLDAGGVRSALPGFVPVWSPDGLRIVTTSPEDESSLVVIERDGNIAASIPDAAGPSWQRLAP